MQLQRRMGLNGSDELRMVVLGVLLVMLLLVGSPQAARAAQPGPTTGYVEICKDQWPGVSGVFTFAIEGLPGTYRVAVGTCTAPIEVPAGRVRIRETNLPGDIIMVDARVSPPGSRLAFDSAQSTVDVNVPAGGRSAEVVVWVTNVPAGYFEICKEAFYLTGTFPITYTPRNYPWLTATVNVPVGACTAPIKVPAGRVDFAEEQRPGVRVIDVQVRIPNDGTIRVPFSDGVFSVEVPRGDAARELVLTVENRPEATLKLCKVAGTRVAEGTEFPFRVTDGKAVWALSIPAGPAPGGFCKFVQFPDGYLAGTPINITEQLPPMPGYTWLPPTVTIVGGTPETAVGTSVNFVLGPGLNVVTFTNRLDAGDTRIKVCKVAGDGVADGTEFRFVLTAQGRPTIAISVPAGRQDGGYCKIVEDVFHEGDVVTVTEDAQDGVQTTAISVLPANRQASPPDLGGRSVSIFAGDGVSTVTFTNARR